MLTSGATAAGKGKDVERRVGRGSSVSATTACMRKGGVLSVNEMSHR
jgi:hypothetical protein